jgi:hypothetical protein
VSIVITDVKNLAFRPVTGAIHDSVDTAKRLDGGVNESFEVSRFLI